MLVAVSCRVLKLSFERNVDGNFTISVDQVLIAFWMAGINAVVDRAQDGSRPVFEPSHWYCGGGISPFSTIRTVAHQTVERKPPLSGPLLHPTRPLFRCHPLDRSSITCGANHHRGKISIYPTQNRGSFIYEQRGSIAFKALETEGTLNLV